MYRTKSDVEKYVESLIVKLCTKDIRSRALSIARLYFDVEDYAKCQEYVEKYLVQESGDAAAYKLLGQALQKLGRKELALERYVTSLDLDPTQTSTILNICELLTDNKVPLEPERAQHWCDKADEAFPKHAITFRLRKRIITMYNLDSETLVKLLEAQIEAKPQDASFHLRLLEHYISSNEIKQAFEYGCKVEFNTKEVFPFEKSSPTDNYAWYKLLNKILDLYQIYSGNANVKNNWLYQLLFLTVRERLCFLGLRENSSVTNLLTKNEIIYDYDEALQIVADAGSPSGFDEFHANLLQHHRGQFAFHAGTHLVETNRTFHDDSRRESGVLMLLAFQSVPFICKDNPVKEIRGAVNRWYLEAVYRCSQSGHYLIREYNNRQLDIPHNSSNDTNWKERVYDKVYNTKYSAYRENKAKLKSYWLSSNSYKIPLNRKPHEAEVKAYDGYAQKYFEKQRDSLQYFVWTLLQYENYEQCQISPTISVCGPDTLNMLDINAFLYCTALRSGMPKRHESHHPAHIAEQLYSNFQRVWWNCTQKDGATFSDDDKVIFKRGIEIIRCIDHGLDVELLCKLGRIFSEKAKTMISAEEKKTLEQRASLYYESAIPLLEKICSTPMFETKQKNFLSSKESDKLIEESRLYVGIHHRNINEYDKSIEILTHLKSGEGFYHIAQTYKKNALEINSNTEVSKTTIVSLLTNAKKYAYRAKEHLKNKQNLYIDNKELLEDIEIQMNNIDPDSTILFSDFEKHYSNKINSSSNAPTNFNRNQKIATDSQILESVSTDLNNQNTTEEAKKLQLSETEIKQEPNTNKNESEDIKEIIKKLDNLTNEVNELKDFSFKAIDTAKSVVDRFLSGTCNNNHQIIIPPPVPTAPAISVASTIPTVPVVPMPTLTSMLAVSLPTSKTTNFTESNKVSPSLPVNVLKTSSSSDSMPSCASTPAQALSVKISPKHIKGTPHNNQITIPTPNEAKIGKPSVISFPMPDKNVLSTLFSSSSNWKKASQSASCEQPKLTTTRTTSNKSTSSTTSPWGDMFKPKPGSWECQSCFVRNEVKLCKCSACNTTKDPTAVKSNVAKENTVKFSFGIPSQYAASVLSKPKKESNRTDFRDEFKLQESSWECKQCFVRNEGNTDNCIVCNSSKDPKKTHFFDAPKKSCSSNIFDTSATAVKFRFGLNPTTKSKNSEEPTKASVLPKPKKEFNSFANKENGEFGFVFKPTISGKSPAKSSNKNQGDESDGEDYINEEDCHAHFDPVPMPDKVDVVTGEENEVELYSHRARLYRFVSSEWKERGTGRLKILKHNETNKIRVVMRREQVLKICLNHALIPGIIYKPKDEKSWLFAANDFSDGELSLQQLCLRFQNKDIALQFKEAVDNALAGKAVCANKLETKTETDQNDNDVEFVSETQASEEEKKKARELMLPENFYNYKNINPCKGCRGCEKDDGVKPVSSSTAAIKAILSAPPVTSNPGVETIVANTPVKTTF